MQIEKTENVMDSKDISKQSIEDEYTQGIFEISDFDDVYVGCCVCAQCGYRFTVGDEVLRVKATGDIVHRDCFIDYADDNIELLTSQTVLAN